ncbi:MAG: NAD(P)/FAD-dependent oxidoreductase [Crocinitomicaceae bacterium]|nr:NAD(P)/FAD-dependent oxidoreductase [Crocinitomicaceae bacterium]
MEHQYDVVIIGAGPSGAVAGARLTQDNLSVLVLEKMEFPRFVIGESLLPQSMDYLDKVNMLDCIKAQKFQVKTGVTFYHNEEVCEFLFKDRYSEGWDYTYQVKREDFDLALIKEAEAQGVNVIFNAEVTDVKTSSDKQEIKYVDASGVEHEVSSRFVIDASGYGRVLPRMFNLEKPAVSIPRGSIFSHVEDVNRSESAGDNIFVHAFRNNSAWIWSIPFSDNTASVGVVGDVDFIKECGENNGEKFKTLVNTFPGLEDRFSHAKFKFDPKQILGYSISVEKMYGEGFVLCGNSTEFLDPVFSSGVTLAVASGYEAADLVCKQLKGEQVDWDTDYVQFMMDGIEVFRSYVDGWYNGNLHTIFFAPDGNPEFKKQICSVLAGYVWDKTNPFVKKHDTLLPTLAKVISITT